MVTVEPRIYDHRLWLRGLDGACHRFIASIPEELRARWKTIVFVESYEGLPPRDGIVYLLFVRGGRWVSLPIVESMLVDAAPQFAELMAKRAEEFHAPALVPRRGSPD